MEVRRFTLTVPDERGRPHRGEVLLAERWQPELAEPGRRKAAASGSSSSASRRRLPRACLGLTSPSARPRDQSSAACRPRAACRLRRPRAARQNRLPRLLARRHGRLCRGSHSFDRVSPVAPQRVFPSTKGAPRLELLARALLSEAHALEADRDVRRFLAALASALTAPAAAPVDMSDRRLSCQALAEAAAQADAKLRREADGGERRTFPHRRGPAKGRRNRG